MELLDPSQYTDLLQRRRRGSRRRRARPMRTVDVAVGDVRGGVAFTLPFVVVSEANRREHWTEGARRAAEQRWAAAAFIRPWRHRLPRLPAVVTLMRIGPGSLLDDDNLARAFKAVRDGVSDVYGVDDGDRRYTWLYDQEPGARSGVRITIVAAG